MTKQQVITFIRTKMVKPYIALGMPQSTFSEALKRVEDGNERADIESAFLQRLGFIMDTPATYKETEFPPVRFRV